MPKEGEVLIRNLPAHGGYCRIAAIDHVGIQVFIGDGLNGKDAMAATNYVAIDDGFSTDPDALLQDDGANLQIESRLAEIVAAGEQHGFLTEADIVHDHDMIETIDPDQFANPDMITNFQKPGIFDIYPWLDDHPFANLSSKNPKQKDFNTTGWIERIHKKKNVGKIPESSLQPGGIGRIPGIIVTGEVSS